MWNSKRVLVTGAGGFIASHLSERLVFEGAEVTALVHYSAHSRIGSLGALPEQALSAINVVTGDITDPDGMRSVIQGMDVVFHLAALISVPHSYGHPHSHLRTNTTGTLNVVQAALHAAVGRMVHVSTSEVYGSAKYAPIDEAHPLQAQSPYAASKIAAECIVQSYRRTHGLTAAIVRPFNNYGPRQSGRAVVPTILWQTLFADQVNLGALHTVRDFLYVKDTVTGLMAAGQSDRATGEVINLGTGIGHSVEEVAIKALEVVGQEKAIVTEDLRLRPKDSEVTKLICDASRATQLLDWTAKENLRDGLAATAEYVRANPTAFGAKYRL